MKLENDKPARRTRRSKRAGEQGKHLRSLSADDVAGETAAAALPPLSFADTMRFGHDLSVALGTRKRGAAKPSVEFEEPAVDMAAAIDAATGDLLVDLISLDAVSTAMDDVLDDLFGKSEEEADVGHLPLRNLPREKQRQIHVNSELGGDNTSNLQHSA